MSGICLHIPWEGTHYLTWKPISLLSKFLKLNWSLSPTIASNSSFCHARNSLLRFPNDGSYVILYSSPATASQTPSSPKCPPLKWHYNRIDSFSFSFPFFFCFSSVVLPSSPLFSFLPSLLKKSVQFSSVAQSCLTLCNPMNCSTPYLPVHHQLPEFTQTRVHQVSDAIQPSHPLSFPSSPAPNPSQHQSLF